MTAQQVYKSVFPSFSVPTDISISQFLQQHNPDDVSPEKPILADFDNPHRTITFGGIREEASKGAGGLRNALGMKEGDFVCIYAQNSVNWALLMHSVMWGGGCFSAINPLATSYELIHYFRITQPKIIAVDANLCSNVQVALKSLSNLQYGPRILLIDNGSEVHAQELLFPRDIITSRTKPLPPPDLSERDNRMIPAGMCFSSGTSGKPKGVLLSHHNLIAHLLTVRSTNPFIHNGHMREPFFPSFAHIYGIVAGVLLSSFVGNYVVAMRQFDFLPYLQRCAQIRATILRVVPAIAIRMVKDPMIQQLDLSSVHTVLCSGAALSSETIRGLQKILDPSASVLNGYGMTEATVSLMRESWGEIKVGSIGKPAAGVSIRIVDDNYNDVPLGKDGECLVKGPTVFMGYKDNESETASTFRDGWLCTGDLVRVDTEGFFWFTGRKKELIKFKGNQVPPAELEAVLLSHPLVVDAGVCGIFDKASDTEVPVGYVSLSPTVAEESRHTVLNEVKAFVDERVAPYKRLRGGLFYLEAMPKGSTGKLLRRVLVTMAEEMKKGRAKL